MYTILRTLIIIQDCLRYYIYTARPTFGREDERGNDEGSGVRAEVRKEEGEAIEEHHGARLHTQSCPYQPPVLSEREPDSKVLMHGFSTKLLLCAYSPQMAVPLKRRRYRRGAEKDKT